MGTEETLWELEEAGWRALSSSPADAAAFYGEHLADDVLMLFPGGFVMDDRQAVIDSMGGTPWSGYRLEDRRVLLLGDGGAVVSYRADAEREGQGRYQALVSSGYVRHGDRWRLAFHQQTPV